jgi:tetratricopeptide (TPR) repeat protein
VFRRSVFAFVASLIVAFPSISEEPRRGKDYIGAAWFFFLDDVQVVYPAANEETRDGNRLSAERRAAFLNQAHGVPAQVVADTDIGEEALRKHLLVLGWDNRLLGSEEVPRPFERGPFGIEFLGLSDSNPDADLLVYTQSPYNPEKKLLFWSRIDPALDRMEVLPILGSDWAIYHDFRPILQGMFLSGPAWPPTRDEQAEGDHRKQLADYQRGWKQFVTDHYNIFYDPSAISPERIQAIGQAREAAYARALEVTGSPGEKKLRIVLKVYPDAERKEEITGLADPAHSIPGRRQLHMIPRFAQTPSPHEEIHILAHHLVAPCALTTLYEGFAIAEDGTYQKAGLDVHAATMIDEGTLPPLADLLDEETARKLPEGLRYPAAGLLARWLRQDFPADAWARAYGLTAGTVDGLAGAIDRPAESVEPLFTAWVKKRAKVGQDDLAFLRAEDEAQRRFLEGDYEGVAAALNKALKAKPDDPQTLFNLASALMRSGRYAAARKRLERLLGLSLPQELSRFEIFGHYQLGRLHDLQGDRESALAEYERVLQLPDRHDSHRLAREAIETPVTEEQLQ